MIRENECLFYWHAAKDTCNATALCAPIHEKIRNLSSDRCTLSPTWTLNSYNSPTTNTYVFRCLHKLSSDYKRTRKMRPLRRSWEVGRGRRRWGKRPRPRKPPEEGRILRCVDSLTSRTSPRDVNSINTLKLCNTSLIQKNSNSSTLCDCTYS